MPPLNLQQEKLEEHIDKPPTEIQPKLVRVTRPDQRAQMVTQLKRRAKKSAYPEPKRTPAAALRRADEVRFGTERKGKAVERERTEPRFLRESPARISTVMRGCRSANHASLLSQSLVKQTLYRIFQKKSSMSQTNTINPSPSKPSQIRNRTSNWPSSYKCRHKRTR